MRSEREQGVRRRARRRGGGSAQGCAARNRSNRPYMLIRTAQRPQAAARHQQLYLASHGMRSCVSVRTCRGMPPGHRPSAHPHILTPTHLDQVCPPQAKPRQGVAWRLPHDAGQDGQRLVNLILLRMGGYRGCQKPGRQVGRGRGSWGVQGNAGWRRRWRQQSSLVQSQVQGVSRSYFQLFLPCRGRAPDERPIP